MSPVGTSPGAHQLLVAAYVLLGAALVGQMTVSSPVRAACLGIILAAGVFAWRSVFMVRPWPPLARRSAEISCAVAGAVVTGASMLSFLAPGLPPIGLLALAIYAAAAARAVGAAPGRRWLRLPPLTTFMAAHLALMSVALRETQVPIDVRVFLEHGARALVAGTNPYRLAFPNIYSVEETSRYYGPGVVADGLVTYGFPYPPPSLLWAVPGHVIGDIRFSGLLALGVLAAVLQGRSRGHGQRVVALALLLLPATMYVLARAWIEPLLVALVGLAVWALRRDHRLTAAVLLGLLFASKQYMVVVLPCLWLLRPQATWKLGGVMVGTAALVTLPFVVVSPSAFWRSVVEWQLIQPLRPESVSLLVAVVNALAWPPPGVYGLLAPVAGLVAGGVFAWRAPPTPAMFAAGAGIAMLATVTLSKQAFVNYYFLVAGAFLVAAWAMLDESVIAQEDLNPRPRPPKTARSEACLPRAVDQPPEVGDGHPSATPARPVSPSPLPPPAPSGAGAGVPMSPSAKSTTAPVTGYSAPSSCSHHT